MKNDNNNNPRIEEEAPSPVDEYHASIPNSDGEGTLASAQVAEMTTDELTEWVEGCYVRPDLTGVETDLDLVFSELDRRGVDPANAWLTAISRHTKRTSAKDLADMEKALDEAWAGEDYAPAPAPSQDFDFEKFGAVDFVGFDFEYVKEKNRRAARAAVDAEEREAASGRVVRRKLTEFTPIAPAFLWRNMVPARGLTLATGEGGALKSSALRWMAAELTRGTLPGEFEGTPHGVMYIAGEEDVAGSVYASFKQSGADLDRVHIWSKEDRDANVSTKSFSVEQDMPELKQWCLDEDIRLVVVDPITQYFGSADINAQNEIRQVLMPWTQLAEQIGGAVVGIAHTNKARSGDMALDVSGSAALTQVARAVLGFAKDDIGGVVSVVKSNVGPKINYEYSLRLDSVVMTNEFGRDSSVKVPVFELGALTTLTSAYVQTGKRMEKGGAEVNTTDIGNRVVHVLYRDARNKAEELELKSPDFSSLAWREDDGNRDVWPRKADDMHRIIRGEGGINTSTGEPLISDRDAKRKLDELKELGFVKQLGKSSATRYVPAKDESS